MGGSGFTGGSTDEILGALWGHHPNHMLFFIWEPVQHVFEYLHHLMDGELVWLQPLVGDPQQI